MDGVVPYFAVNEGLRRESTGKAAEAAILCMKPRQWPTSWAMTYSIDSVRTSSGICLALCLMLPFLTGQIPQIGNMLSPMHIPVLLCGLLCGAPYGAAVGFIAPLLRHLIFGMPAMPSCLIMAFEMAAYGLAAGVLVNRLGRSASGLYLSLIGAMLFGRLVWGAVSFVFYAAFMQTPFTMQMFLAGAFFNALPAIVLHIAIIPPIVMALRRSHIAAAA